MEDDRTSLHFISTILENAGYTVTPARDGKQALEQLCGHSFDLVITDIGMPQMHGLEFLTKLRDERRCPRVVVLTSDSTPETLLHAIREQAHQYLNKPLLPKALLDTVESVLASISTPYI